MKRLFYLSALSALLLSVGGCSENDAPSEPGAVTLLTRSGGDAATNYRLLVFDEAGDECLQNKTFASAGGKVQLAAGSYQFVTLTETAGLALPAAGSVDGLSLTEAIGLQPGVALQPFRISAAEKIVIPDNTVYDAVLQPATCGLVLNVVGEEAQKMTFSLKNMRAGICPNSSYPEATTAYPLQPGTNICLPTNGNAVLTYQPAGGVSSDLFLDIPLEAGYTYTVDLSYSQGVLSFKTTVTDWASGRDPVTGRAEIELTSGIKTQTETTAEVPDTQIASGQQVGIFINEDVTAATVIGANLKYDADGSGGLTLNTNPGQTTPYYPTSGNDVKIIAYQPYSASAKITNEDYNFTVETDQNGNSNKNYYDSDLLYSESKAYTYKAEAQSLVFTHQLSKVVCTLQSGTGSPAIAGATVAIVEAKIGGTFNLSDGTFTINDAATSDVTMNNTITSGSYIAVIPPQTFNNGAKFLKVTLKEGGDFYYKIPNGGDLTLAASNVYTYAITVNKTGLTVTSTITPWGNGGTTPGDAVMGAD
ncbi:MAG: fimbrillin family protein [Parabacteroides gordonii]|uniref:fimbrillin family protein n=1 Tax=Parabacteroides gordonii TaxID=574930 RepID=UPI003A8A4676